MEETGARGGAGTGGRLYQVVVVAMGTITADISAEEPPIAGAYRWAPQLPQKSQLYFE